MPVFLRCLFRRTPYTMWIERSAAGWWTWRIRDRLGRIVGEPREEWSTRGTAEEMAGRTKDGIASSVRVGR